MTLAEEWKKLHDEATIIDLHIHPSMQQELFHRNLNIRYVIDRTLHGNPLTVRASFPLLKKGGYDVILSMIYVPEQGFRKDFPLANLVQYLWPGTWNKLIRALPYDATLSIMADMETAAADSRHSDLVRMVHSVAELDAVLSQPKDRRPIAAIHAIEGSHSLGDYRASDEEILSHLDDLYQRGVAYITLAHFYPNRVVHPCYPWPEDIVHLTAHPMTWRDMTLGLTDLGKRVVARMIDLGMLIDLSHSTPIARRQIYEIADTSRKHPPLLATHVGVYGINPSPYNLSDDEIRRIAADGGVVGVIFMPYWLMPKSSGQGINFISRHIQYLVDVGGEDTVGFGSDFDGFTTPPDDLDNASLMPRLTQRLVSDGHSPERIKKILGGNALRAIRTGWGKKQ